MNNYTIELRELIDAGINIFPENYPFYVEDAQLKKDFENKFIEYYYFDEIGFESPARFKQRLKVRLNMKMNYWTQLYQTQLASEGIEFLLNKDLTETFIRDLKSDKTGSEKNTGTISDNGSDIKNGTLKDTLTGNNTSTDTDNFERNLSSTDATTTDLKQSQLSDGLADSTLTQGSLTNVQNETVSVRNTESGITKNIKDITSENSSSKNSTIEDNTTKTNTTTNDLSKSILDNENVSEETTFTAKGNIGTTSSAELLQKWRDVLINMDEIITDDCRDLFMLIF